MIYRIIFLLLICSPSFARQYVFPKDFQWCVATAGHQIEGDNIHSDWWAWEQIPGKIAHGEKSGKASYHIERLEEDVQIMKDLGAKTYRFSIEWSRIEPKQGQYSQEAINHYKKEIKLLKENNIIPMVTLHHFVQPQWFSEMGGWQNNQSVDMFFNYVKIVEKEFGSDVNYWITFNEPMVLLFVGYGFGIFPPGKITWDFWDSLQNILKVHGKIYHYFHEQAKERGQKIKIGMAHHIRPLKPTGWITRKGVPFFDFIFNWNLPNALKTGEVIGIAWKKIFGFPVFPVIKKITIDGIANTQDIFGINYYAREEIRLSFLPPFILRLPLEGLDATELNWGIDPDGFYEVIESSHKMFPDIPFYITENGLADSEDSKRPDFIKSHLIALHKAMTDLNHPIEGYCYWSLMDNFEWAEGFKPRFGLYHVDYTQQGKRTPRESAKMVEKIFKTNTVEDIKEASN